MAKSKSMKQAVLDNKVGGGIGMAAVCLVAAGVLARNRRAAKAGGTSGTSGGSDK